MTIQLFRDDAYLKSCQSTVIKVVDDGVILDQTVFYPQGGGQPGDTGCLTNRAGSEFRIIDTLNSGNDIVHKLDGKASALKKGDRVSLEINWARRYRLMRMHSCMHLLCSIIPYAVTGGSVREDGARLDFDAEQPFDKDTINKTLNRLVSEDHSMQIRWISDEELDRNPELVRTLSVQPPRGSGKIRLIDFAGVDCQPCGGTHVNSTSEIGAVTVRKIEKKGKHNRRVNVVFDE